MKKIVFITGANKGLGAAIATEFAALDYKVVISGRNFAAWARPSLQRSLLNCDFIFIK